MPKQKYEKAFTRDFSLAMLEVWYKGEAHNPKQWSGKTQAFLPYIVFCRTDGTVKSFYDQQGIEWIKKLKNYNLMSFKPFVSTMKLHSPSAKFGASTSFATLEPFLPRLK